MSTLNTQAAKPVDSVGSVGLSAVARRKTVHTAKNSAKLYWDSPSPYKTEAKIFCDLVTFKSDLPYFTNTRSGKADAQLARAGLDGPATRARGRLSFPSCALLYAMLLMYHNYTGTLLTFVTMPRRHSHRKDHETQRAHGPEQASRPVMFFVTSSRPGCALNQRLNVHRSKTLMRSWSLVASGGFSCSRDAILASAATTAVCLTLKANRNIRLTDVRHIHQSYSFPTEV